MATLLAILSFPFWFAGLIFTFVGIFGSVKLNGAKYTGKYWLPIKLLVTLIGAVFIAIAYAMV